MSWRRFKALLKGLSPNSALVTKQSINEDGSQKEHVVEDPKESERVVAAAWGSKPTSKGAKKQ